MRILIIVFLATCSVASAAEVYRWVDENGQVYYSDRPHEGAEQITLPQAQTFSTPAAQPVRRRVTVNTDEISGKSDQKDKADTYKSVKIVSPSSGEVVWNNGGLMTVSVSTQPALRRGHTLMLYLDDRMVESLVGNRRTVDLTEVFRGEHTLRTEIRNAAGDLVADGNPVTFTVQQTSILNPNNPNRPPIPGPAGPGG